MNSRVPQPMDPPDPADWRAWPFERKRKLLGQLRDAVGEGWRAQAREAQLPPAGEWQKFFLRGGRGSGKSWAGAHIFVELIRNDPAYAVEGPGRWAIVAPTFGDARDKCVESAESGLLMALGTTTGEVEAGISPTVAKWNRSLGELQLRDGTMVHIDGADDGAYRIQGWNMRGCWADEVGLWKKWKAAWEESIGFAVRAGEAKIVVTGTPKRNQPARILVKQLLEDPEVISRRLHTKDNMHNLSPAFIAQVTRHEGTQLGLQELSGELLDDVEGALWKRAWIDSARRERPVAPLRAALLGLDPSDGTQEGDAQGSCLVKIDMDGRLYVTGAWAHRETPMAWLEWAVATAREHGATIIVERNHGSAYLTGLLDRAMGDLGVTVPYKVVTASVGKQVRAEPVAGLYEQGKVHHLGTLLELEDELCSWDGTGASPNLLDSCVWAITEAMGYGSVGTMSGEPAAVPYTDRPRQGVQGAVAYR